VKVYTDQAHNLAGAAHTDSILTVADFFDRRLNGAAQTASAQVPASARTLTSLSEIKPVITARTQSKSTKTALNSRSKKGAKDVRVTAKSSATKVAGKPRETPAKVATAPIRSTTKASGQSASSANAARGAKDTKSRQAAVSRPEPQPAATRTKTPVDRNQVAATR
jgi:hypothetical protein